MLLEVSLWMLTSVLVVSSQECLVDGRTAFIFLETHLCVGAILPGSS